MPENDHESAEHAAVVVTAECGIGAVDVEPGQLGLELELWALLSPHGLVFVAVVLQSVRRQRAVGGEIGGALCTAGEYGGFNLIRGAAL